MSRRSLALALAVAVLAVALATLLWLEVRRPASDEDRIRALIDAAARAADEKRADGVVQALSDDFDAQGLDRRATRQLVAFHLLRAAWVSAVVSGEAIAVDRDEARAAVDVILSRSGKGRPAAELLPEAVAVHRFDLRLARTASGWKVTGASWRRISIDEAMAGPRLSP